MQAMLLPPSGRGRPWCLEKTGRVGWSLHRIEREPGMRKTSSGYLTAAGIPVRQRGGRVADWPPPDPATTARVSTDLAPFDPVFAADPIPDRAPTASAYEPYRKLIVEALGLGQNAMAIWLDLVDVHEVTEQCARGR